MYFYLLFYLILESIYEHALYWLYNVWLHNRLDGP